jgi:hypothetical protein
MFDWITKIFNSKPNDTVERSDEEKKRSSDDFVTQAIIFPNASQALNPIGSSESTDAGSSDGGGSSGD